MPHTNSVISMHLKNQNLIKIKIIYFLLSLLLFSLGAVHDGSGSASFCDTSANYIMTTQSGNFANITNSFYFSQCSIDSFESFLLTSNRMHVLNNFYIFFYGKFIYFLNSRLVSHKAKCLTNSPSNIFSN